MANDQKIELGEAFLPRFATLDKIIFYKPPREP